MNDHEADLLRTFSAIKKQVRESGGDLSQLSVENHIGDKIETKPFFEYLKEMLNDWLNLYNSLDPYLKLPSLHAQLELKRSSILDEVASFSDESRSIPSDLKQKATHLLQEIQENYYMLCGFAEIDPGQDRAVCATFKVVDLEERSSGSTLSFFHVMRREDPSPSELNLPRSVL